MQIFTKKKESILLQTPENRNFTLLRFCLNFATTLMKNAATDIKSEQAIESHFSVVPRTWRVVGEVPA